MFYEKLDEKHRVKIEESHTHTHIHKKLWNIINFSVFGC